MPRRRSSGHSHDSDLPPTRRARWLAVLALWVLLASAWATSIWLAPTTLLGGAGSGGSAGLRGAYVSAVAVVLVVLVIHAQWRLRLEILARKPGPLLIYPIQDRSATTGGPNGRGDETGQAESVRADLQRRILATQLQRSTPIPPAGDSSYFLQVVENAGGKLEGFWGALLRLAHFLAPISSYEVRCSILGPDTVHRHKPEEKCVLLVELTRLPRIVVPPEIIIEATWTAAAEAAGDWLVATVLPRTRQCALPPWTLRRNLKIPWRLFHRYQQFRKHRDAEDYQQAKVVLTEALREDSTNLALRLDLGKIHEQEKNYLAALATYEDIIARAARLDRRLAYLRFGAPSDNNRRGRIPERNWHDKRRAWGLHPLHPVVYTARYRYALLLGLGREIAEQWREEGGLAKYDALRRRFVEAYRVPVKRLHKQLPDPWKDMKGTSPEENPIEPDELIDHILTIPRNSHDDRAHRTAGMEVFLTSMGVWEAEHLIIERTGAPLAFRYRREHRKIVTDRALRLLLPRAILRRALAFQEFFNATNDQKPDVLRQAQSSMIYPINEPVVEPALDRLLADGWPTGDQPTDGGILFRFIERVAGHRRGSLRGWQFHYNAACTLSTLLMAPKFENSKHPWARQKIVSAIVTELEKSVACGDLGYIASVSNWVGEEDPDLNEVRKEVQFQQFLKELRVD